MGFGSVLGDLVGGAVGALPFPGAGVVGRGIAGIGDTSSGSRSQVSRPVPGLPGAPFPMPDLKGGNFGNGAARNGNCAPSVVAQPTRTTRLQAPPGMVIVECPRGSGNKVAMDKGYARTNGFWKPARKPPIKASDWRCLMRAEAVTKKIDRVVSASNKVSGKRRLTRAKPSGR